MVSASSFKIITSSTLHDELRGGDQSERQDPTAVQGAAAAAAAEFGLQPPPPPTLDTMLAEELPVTCSVVAAVVLPAKAAAKSSVAA